MGPAVGNVPLDNPVTMVYLLLIILGCLIAWGSK